MKKNYTLLLIVAVLIVFARPLNAQNGWTVTVPSNQNANSQWALQEQANGSIFVGSHLINPQGVATATNIDAAALSASNLSVGKQSTGEPIVYGCWGDNQLFRQKINANMTVEWLGITTVPFTGVLYPNEQGDVFIANYFSYQGNFQAYNLKIAKVSNGALKWQKTIPIPQPVIYFSNVIPFSDGSMVLVMYNETTLFLTKYDALGNQVWQKQETSLNPGFKTVVSPITNGFVVYTQSNMFYFNNNGLKTNQFVQPSLEHIAFFPDGSFVTAGVGGNVDLLLTKYNSTGTSLWVKQYGANDRNEYLGKIIPLSDGGVAAATTAYDLTGNLVLGGFIVRTDANGNAGTIDPPQPPTVCTGNLLQNPGFEASPNKLANWFGTAQATSTQANTGTTALSVCANGAVLQTLTASANKQYTMSAFAKTTGAANGAIRLKFMSAGFQVLLEEYLPFSNSNYAQLTTTKTSPINTAYVEVALVKTGGSACVLADDFCLTVSGGGNQTQPDLVLQNFTPTTLASLPNEGINGSVNIHNNGLATSTQIYITLYLSNDQILSANDLNLGETSPGLVTIGDDVAIPLSFGPPASVLPGQYFLLAKVDSREAVVESDEVNNLLVLPYQVLGGGVPNCVANATAPWQEWISKVKIGTKESVSSKFFHTDQGTPFFNMVKNAATPISITATWSYLTTDENIRIWIDYNHDQIYQPSEKAFEGILTKPANGLNVTKALTGSITVPASALVGQADMRVMMRRGVYPDACGEYEFGEIEYYKVTIAQSLTTGTGGRDLSTFENTANPEQITDYQLFPNPAGEILNIDLTQWVGKNGKLIFLNQLGKVVFEKTFENINTPIETMDLSSFNNGQYFVKMETAGQRTQVKRLVVSRMY
jgi:hypothetical protein